MSRFRNFAADAAKNKLRFAWFFETAVRAVLIDSLIRINSMPKILRSYFLHCLGLKTETVPCAVLVIFSWQCFIPVSWMYLNIQRFSRLSHDSFSFPFRTVLLLFFCFLFFSSLSAPPFFVWWYYVSFSIICFPRFLYQWIVLRFWFIHIFVIHKV